VSFLSYFTKKASASHFWKATPSRNYRYGPKCLVGVPSFVLCGFQYCWQYCSYKKKLLAIL